MVSQMAYGLIEQAEAQAVFQETCRTLHHFIGILIAKHGSMVDTDYDSLATPPVMLDPGWDVMLYEPSEEELEIDPPLQSEPRDQLDILVTPAEAPGGGYVIPYLTESDQFWISVGTNGARLMNRQGSSELSTEDLQNIEYELHTLISPQLKASTTKF